MRGVTGSTILLVGLPLLGLGVVGAPVAPRAAVASTTRTASSSNTSYAVNRRICKTPKKRRVAACFAEERVLVKLGTKGARAFVRAAGATGAGTIGPAGGLTPSDLGTAYGVNTTGGSGQTVAIVDAYNNPKLAADLATFNSHYGLAPCPLSTCLEIVNQTGGSTLPANDTQGWSVEESLDVEAVHSVCQACKIIVVEANSASNADLAIAENEAVALGATEVSNSFGAFESDTDPTFRAAFNHPGTVIAAAVGDDGYYNFDQLSAVNEPDVPASYSTVVAVGGNFAVPGPERNASSRDGLELQRDRGFLAAALLRLAVGRRRRRLQHSFHGAGLADPPRCLAEYSLRPQAARRGRLGSWRLAHRVRYLRLVQLRQPLRRRGTGLDDGRRYVADAPIIAAIFGLAGGAHGVPYPALTLYGHRAVAYDVTVGGNGWCNGEGAAGCGNPNTLGYGVVDCDYPATGTTPSVGNRACDALAGYDGPTGVGTPGKGLGLFTKIGPTATIGGPTSVTQGTSSAWTTTATDPFPGGAVTSYTWNWGDGTAPTVTSTGSAAHTYTVGGVNRTITLTMKDNYNVTGVATRSVTVT